VKTTATAVSGYRRASDPRVALLYSDGNTALAGATF
jgi:hypothetical protein